MYYIGWPSFIFQYMRLHVQYNSKRSNTFASESISTWFGYVYHQAFGATVIKLNMSRDNIGFWTLTH